MPAVRPRLPPREFPLELPWLRLEGNLLRGRALSTRVVNLRHEPYDVRVDRCTGWGNPFRIGQDGNRTEVITKYQRWVIEGTHNQASWIRSNAHTLRGRTLGCHCAPEACHGEFLAWLAEMKRYKAGTLVTGTIQLQDGSRLHVFERTCEEHLFELNKSFYSKSKDRRIKGIWLQGATCVVCGRLVPPVSIEWWQQKADRRAVRRARIAITEEMQQLREARRRLRSFV